MIGSTDTHNSASPVVESDYFGKLGRADGTPDARLANRSDRPAVHAPWQSQCGLLERRRTCRHLGPREHPRRALRCAAPTRDLRDLGAEDRACASFAGFEFTPDDLRREISAERGYAKGVPMGGELRARAAREPRFLVAPNRIRSRRRSSAHSS